MPAMEVLRTVPSSRADASASEPKQCVLIMAACVFAIATDDARSQSRTVPLQYPVAHRRQSSLIPCQ